MPPADRGTLYLCATPIGNLEDITLRALRVLKEVDLIAAEDTRRTRKLCSRYDIRTPLTSYHEHSPPSKARRLLEDLRAGKSIALVADAGLPGISDPGHELVVQAIQADVPVVVVPGPSVVTSALVVSGLPTRAFRFEGFLPRRRAERRPALERLCRETETLVFFEAPHRLLHTLADMLECLGDRRIAVVRELTKVHEQVVRCSISEALAHFREHRPRGEFALVVAGAEPAPEAEPDRAEVEAALSELLAQGLSTRDAVRRVSELYGLPRRHVYAVAHGLRAGED
ncbi:MAG: 16S rRNA (cytidine(1402)-2'-O)-methyltransferase [Armatimonadota bacterium]